MRSFFTRLMLLLMAAPALVAGDLGMTFRSPPASARPGVYWYFMDGNQDRDQMVADLEAMSKVGIGSVLFLEVRLSMPAGPIPFMSETWQDNVAHAIKTTERLGMEFILGTGPGWSGSGGSWVRPQDSMQHLVGGEVQVNGPGVVETKLPVPKPLPPNHFAGMSDAHAELRKQWYHDVAVLAFPTPEEGGARLSDSDLKRLKDVHPYSIRFSNPLPFVMPQADYSEPLRARVIDSSRIIDLTSQMKPDGSLRWDVPAGKWTVMRFVARSTGQTTRPAPRTGHGFECDKFSVEAYRRHWEHYQAALLRRLDHLTKGKGLTTIHLDSWEMSSQNWSAAFREEFTTRRGYDPQPFYPAYLGMVVGSLEQTERFLWDMRKTAQELVLENHAGAIKQIAHDHGLIYSNEPYDMNPAGDIDLGSVADIPACEFWNARGGPDTQYSCIEAVSIAHTMGKSQVNAEAFTSDPSHTYLEFPGSLKNQTDWAFALGINGLIFHTFQHQPLGDGEKPGMNMGPYGVQWHRNQTWWHLSSDYHAYITRCQAVLRQGQAVADILYLTPEGAPHIFIAPPSALQGSPRLEDKKGHNFDAVTPRILKMRAQVEDGNIVFPGGSRYSVMILPDVATMTPETLAFITAMVKSGATVIGNPPRKSPSLVNFPACDEQVRQAAAALWGETPQAERKFGKGRILLNTEALVKTSTTDARSQDLYPSYAFAAAVLASMGIPEDFQSDGRIRYGHRRTETEEIYFVANTCDQPVSTTCRFRVREGAPELWNPLTAQARPLADYSRDEKTTSIPLRFEAHQSFFVVFPRGNAATSPPATMTGNFPDFAPVATLEGAWQVSFDPKWGGPERIEIDSLQDWTRHAHRGVRYYSGSAIYRKTFDQPAELKAGGKIALDLGIVHDICRVRLNGKDLGILWTAPWRVDVTSQLLAEANNLEIEVINRWGNRLIGDQQPEDKDARTVSWKSGLLGGQAFKTGRYTFSTFGFHKADSPLQPSGLLGPVRILQVAP